MYFVQLRIASQNPKTPFHIEVNKFEKNKMFLATCLTIKSKLLKSSVNGLCILQNNFAFSYTIKHEYLRGSGDWSLKLILLN